MTIIRLRFSALHKHIWLLSALSAVITLVQMAYEYRIEPSFMKAFVDSPTVCVWILAWNRAYDDNLLMNEENAKKGNHQD